MEAVSSEQVIEISNTNQSRKNLERWMENLPESLHHASLHSLAIPGSHDSCSFSITRNSDISPDEPDLNNSILIHLLGCMSKHVVYNWCKTQALSCTEQMESGIRYFDLRVTVQEDSKELFICHGLYGAPVSDMLKEIKSFLQSHKKEVVLIDFQHFYGLGHEEHHNLLHQLTEIFGALLCPHVNDLSQLNLTWLWERGFQVLVFYRDPVAQYHPFLWPADCIPNPWANTTSVKSLMSFLSENYQKGRPLNKFYVTQGIRTPTLTYILLHMFGSLKNEMVSELNGYLYKWITEKVAGPNGLNVVICDFIEMDDCNIPHLIVNLNYKNQMSQTDLNDQ